MGLEEDLVLLVAVAIAFAAWVVVTHRLFRRFIMPGVWRGPTPT